MKRTLNLALGVGLAGLFLWLALRHVDGEALAAAARGLSPAALVLAPVCLAIGYAARIQRWRMMLRPSNPDLGLGRCGVAFLASIAVNNLLPFRMGDVMRCVGFSGWLRVDPGPVLATVLVERLLDMITLLLALALALWAFSLDSHLLQFAGSSSLVLGAMALLLLLQPRLLAPLFRLLVRLAARISPTSRATVEAFFDPLLATLIALSGRRMMPALMGWSVLVWLFEGATYWAVARAMPALPVPEAAWLAMPMGTLSTLLPSTPGHIGTFDYFAQLATVAAGNPLAEATAFVLIIHLALWLPTTLSGGACLLVWAFSRRAEAKA